MFFLISQWNKQMHCFFILDELLAKNYLNNYQTYLFNMSSLIFNNGPQSRQESFTGDTQHFLRDQVPFSC
jgi:hypothetical protein